MKSLSEGRSWFHPFLVNVKSQENNDKNVVEVTRVDVARMVAEERERNESLLRVVLLLLLLSLMSFSSTSLT